MKIQILLLQICLVFPACAVTRATSKNNSKQNNSNESSDSFDFDLSDTFVGQTMLTDRTPLNSSQISNCNISLPNNESLSSKNLSKDQKDDPELSVYFDNALSEQDASLESTCYFIKNGILMRKFTPPEALSDSDWEIIYQVVVPHRYRQQILSLAHESSLAGHLGVTKTYHKIMQHFFWPKMRKSVANYIKTCHTCQVVGKPNQKIPKAPLKPIPAFSEPFSHLLIDC